MKTLHQLTKEDLIRVIANMHDAIGEWVVFCKPEDAQVLNNIGSLCVSDCVNKQDWNLPK
jgi:hypothetical protein